MDADRQAQVKEPFSEIAISEVAVWHGRAGGIWMEMRQGDKRSFGIIAVHGC